jgi:hypothetical protein
MFLINAWCSCYIAHQIWLSNHETDFLFEWSVDRARPRVLVALTQLGK